MKIEEVWLMLELL